MFNLANFEKEIREMAQANSKTLPEALDMFILNLKVMQAHYSKGVEGINFRAEGQKWNTLTSVERNSQKHALLEIFEKTGRTRTTTRE